MRALVWCTAVLLGASCTGTAGDAGPKGPPGPRGVAGPTGAVGAAGATGSEGGTGASGATGATGTAGVDGTTGSAGVAGAIGATGAAGPVGPSGPAGALGPTGPAGPTGAMGAPGPNGVFTPPSAPNAGLLAHYRGTGVDLSGRGVNLTVSGVELTEDRFGQPTTAGRFGSDGGVHFLETPDLPSLPQGNAPRTFSVWMRAPLQSSTGTLVNSGTQSTTQRFGILFVSGSTYFVGENRDIPGSLPMCDNEWHHVVVVYDGSLVRTYIDLELSGRQNYVLNTQGRRLSIGRSVRFDTAFESFRGEVDDVRIYDRALSWPEIVDLYRERGWVSPWLED